MDFAQRELFIPVVHLRWYYLQTIKGAAHCGQLFISGQPKQFDCVMLEICETGDDEKQKYDIVGSEEVFPLNPDSADLCAIARAKSPKTNQGENMPPGGIIVKNDDDDADVGDKDIIVKNDDDNIGWLQR